MPTLPTNADGSLRYYTAQEVAEIDIQTRGIRDGSGLTRTRRIGSSTEERFYSIRADKFDEFCVLALGASVIYNDSGTDRLSRLMPLSPPGYDKFIATQITGATGFKFTEDDETGTIPQAQFERLDVKVLFEHVPFDLANDDEVPSERFRYVERLPSQAQAQAITLPGGVLKYTRNPALPNPADRPHGVPIPYNVSVIQPTAIISRRWHRLPEEAWNETSPLWLRMYGNEETGEIGLIGTVNSNRLMGFEKGTMLMLEPEESIEKDQLGDRLSVTLTYRWLHKPSHHLFFLYYATAPGETGNNGPYLATVDETYATADVIADGKALFNTRNHNSAWQVG